MENNASGKIDGIEELGIILKRSVSGFLSGDFPSKILAPEGIEFAEIREFEPGDSLSEICWPPTIREGKYFVRLNEADKGVTVLFVNDLSKSGKFGSSGVSKEDLQASLTSLLGEALNYGANQLGFIGFSDKVSYFPPSQGADIFEILKRMAEIPKGSFTNLALALEFAINLTLDPGLIFILSDFIVPLDYGHNLGILAKRHDVIPFILQDLREIEIPRFWGYAAFRDLETGEIKCADNLKPTEEYPKFFDEFDLEYLVFKTRDTKKDQLMKLIEFFQERERRVLGR